MPFLTFYNDFNIKNFGSFPQQRSNQPIQSLTAIFRLYSIIIPPNKKQAQFSAPVSL
jgi:hypothetical protein